jgi:hypothetical protein
VAGRKPVQAGPRKAKKHFSIGDLLGYLIARPIGVDALAVPAMGRVNASSVMHYGLPALGRTKRIPTKLAPKGCLPARRRSSRAER